MMSEKQDKMIRLRFSCQESDDTLEISLPADMMFEDITGELYREGYVYPQKPGYYYIIRDHLCGARQHLSDYLPENADSLDIQVFGMPQIMV